MFKKNGGILGTIIFHIGILVIVIIFGFSTPLPLPEEEGILVNFGTDEFGIGDTDPRVTEVPEEESVNLPEQSISSTSEEANLSQDYEEAPAIENASPEETQLQAEELVTEEDKAVENKEEQVTPPEPEPREVNKRALYPGKTETDNTTEGEGITEGEGNQGSPTGSANSDNYANVLSQGEGGVTWNLEGRNPITLPKPEYKDQLEGTVVVRIRVDRNGRVTSAEAGMKGSTSTDRRLLEAAREAALKARFDTKDSAPITQQGSLTYIFILQ